VSSDPAVRERQPFRRRLLVRRLGPTSVEAELQDHLHHVAVTIGYQHGRVSSVQGRGVRLPWSLCPGAIAQLHELVGSEVGATPSVADLGAHCTHLLECAASAIRFAGSDAASHRYDVSVSDWHTPVATAAARREDGLELVVETDGKSILAPEHLSGRALGAGFTRWANQELDADHLELAVLLRRAIWMRWSLKFDLDAFDVLSESGVHEGSCYASQAQRIHIATRNRGSSLRELPG
jgi:hypothetical protein